MSLRDEIGDTLMNFRILGLSIKEGEDRILALLAPTIEKAKKWDRVSSLVEGNCNSCNAFSHCEKNDIHPCEILKDALTEEEAT